MLLTHCWARKTTVTPLIWTPMSPIILAPKGSMKFQKSQGRYAGTASQAAQADALKVPLLAILCPSRNLIH